MKANCIGKQNNYGSEDIPEIVQKTQGTEKLQEKIDYSDLNNWLAAPVKNNEAVDLFYLYPSGFFPEDGADMIADLDDEQMCCQAE